MISAQTTDRLLQRGQHTWLPTVASASMNARNMKQYDLDGVITLTEYLQCMGYKLKE